jgi:hypothetical protein
LLAGLYRGEVPVILPHPLRAPVEDRTILAEPPLAEVGSLLVMNRHRLVEARADILGRPLADLQTAARTSVVAAARAHLQRAGEPLPPAHDSPLILAGHQPELFHPGVWIKNFALNGLARAHGLTPLNLVVDNDTVKTVGLHLPRLSQFTEPELDGPSSPPTRPVLVAFDRLAPEIPYEERPVLDETLFADFPNRTAAITRRWNFAPLLPAFWSEVRRQTERTRLLGERFAAARRAVERSWGCHNLEIPVSLLCTTEPFAWFACHLLAELPRFHAIYNTCLAEYRRAYGLRSRAHPVPDLAVEGDWLEVPLWAWRADQPRRGRLLARLRADRVELRVGEATWPSLPFAGGNPEPMVTAWQALHREGYKLRSRALTNTLFARVFLGELFIHGIGGGKYDELTDEIIRRFYGFEPPAFLVLSATLRLPLPTFPRTPDDCRRLAHELRDIRCNPQRHLESQSSQALKLATGKHAWIEQQPTDAPGRRERFQVLKTLTQQLQRFTSAAERRTEHELRRCKFEVQLNAILQRRDYAFCLFPEGLLREFCGRLLSDIA